MKKANKPWHRMYRLRTTCPAAATPHLWKTDLARSRPIAVSDRAGSQLITPTSLHCNAVEEVIHAIKGAVSRRYMLVDKLAFICIDVKAARIIALG